MHDKKSTITDWLGVLVAFGGLFIGWYSFNTQNEFARKTQIAAQQPLLNIEYLKNDSNENYGLLLKNIGAGTAIVEKFDIYINKDAFDKGDSKPSWLNNNNLLWFNNDEQYWYDNINYLTQGHAIANAERGDIWLLSTRALTKTQIDNGNIGRKDRGKFYSTTQAKALCEMIIEIRYRSATPIDENLYILTYSESFLGNNIRSEIAVTTDGSKNVTYESCEPYS